MFNDEAISYDSREQQFSVMGAIGSTAGFLLNPVNHYLYNPNAWSISKGTVSFSAKFPTAIARGAISTIDKVGSFFGHDPRLRARMRLVLKGHERSQALYNGKALDVNLLPGRSSQDIKNANIGIKKQNQMIVDTRQSLINKQNRYSDLQRVQRRRLGLLGGKIKELRAALNEHKVGVVTVGLEQRPVTQTIASGIDGVYNKSSTIHPFKPQLAWKGNAYKYAKAEVGMAQAKSAFAESKSLYDRATRGVAATQRAIDKLPAQQALVRRSFGEVAARYSVRLGIGAAKATSFVMLGSLIWDVANLVGEPIGRSIMNKVNDSYSALTNIGRPEMGQLALGYINMGAATERQRALAAISRSQLNGRSAFGSEGMLMHQ